MELKAFTYVPPDTACDVITLKNGNLIYCRIKSTGHSVIEYTPCGNPSAPSIKIGNDSVFMINSLNGRQQTIIINTNNSASAISSTGHNKSPVFYGALTGCFTLPVGDYATTQNRTNSYSELVNNAGYATPGLGYGANVEVNVVDGFGGIFQAGYCNYGFDAQDFLNDNSYSGALTPIYDPYYKAKGNVNNTLIEVNSNYSYTNYSFFIGLKKDFNYEKKAFFGVDFSYGLMFLNMPSLTSTVTVKTTDSLGKQSSTNYNWQVAASHANIGVMNLGINAKFIIPPHIYCTFKANLLVQASGSEYYTIPSSLIDANGNTLASSALSMSTIIVTLNLGFGVGCYF